MIHKQWNQNLILWTKTYSDARKNDLNRSEKKMKEKTVKSF